jgi:phosphopantothenoylcysteine decarboxylase / phosphopantothenate---cysteine ligase
VTGAAVLDGRTIVLAVTGGISAYKAVEVCRRLVDAGAHVAPIMTEGAERFVGRTTLSALASQPVQTSLFDEHDPIPHTRLGQRADLVLVCPATARLLGSYAAGISDDLLTATLLATRAPVMVCPAMHTEMWEHPAVQHNVRVLADRGVHVVAPETGRLAGGDVGAGRLAEPATVVAAVEALLGRPAGDIGATGAPPGDLAGRRVLVSAGGTREAIDPVRVITNRSSGKQGYAVAEAALARGAEVTLVSTVDRPAPAGATLVRVASAADMQAAIVPVAPDQDVIVMAAAVADFTVAAPATRKIKKGGLPELRLVPTHDFLVDLGRDKPAGQVLVGFAAETDDVLANAADKLARKHLDLIVANDVSAPGVGFEHDTNAVTILGADGTRRVVSLAGKRAIAEAILDEVAARLKPV